MADASELLRVIQVTTNLEAVICKLDLTRTEGLIDLIHLIDCSSLTIEHQVAKSDLDRRSGFKRVEEAATIDMDFFTSNDDFFPSVTNLTIRNARMAEKDYVSIVEWIRELKVENFAFEFTAESVALLEFITIADQVFGLGRIRGRLNGTNQLTTNKANCEVACLKWIHLPYGLQMKSGAWLLMIHERPHAQTESPLYCFSISTGTANPTSTMTAQCTRPSEELLEEK